ncbi:YchJ family metal-binding protein [Nannocystis pusilla]|uniref:YchJ family metal-binding protein n=1 Tax=Nannocystis pusilla TaxID=889268 RepID=A0A9X3EV33_9BACT|nr:YchJ family metal-binding protein [Nannocystis pusilla]MCY1010808.1 YchJ family metal-binding protein [Nannocystis pusilla]
MSRRCPCGRRTFESCCGPLLAGAQRAETAEDLMRSRYTAYVEGAVDYLLETTSATTRGSIDRQQLAAYCRGLRGMSLRIVDTVAGGAADDTGVVEFEASLKSEGRRFVQRERSRFVREDGRWVYVDGDVQG